MRKVMLFTALLFVGLLAACGAQGDAGVTPAAEKLTFLFFYTDG